MTELAAFLFVVLAVEWRMSQWSWSRDLVNRLLRKLRKW